MQVPRRRSPKRLVYFSLYLLFLLLILFQLLNLTTTSFSTILTSLSFVPPVPQTSLPTFRTPVLITKSSSHHFVAITTIIHNEASYILEWIAYHISQHNISHFYLYDHQSTDDIMTVLHPLITRGIVTFGSASEALLSFPKLTNEEKSFLLSTHVATQKLCLHHFYIHYSKNVTWSISMDVDEFLYGNESITNILKNMPSYTGGVHFTRVPFSTSGRESIIRRDELSTAIFFERMKYNELLTEAGKVAYKISTLQGWPNDVHRFSNSTGSLMNVKGKLAKECEKGNCGQNRTENPLKILHYLPRSYDDCLEKRKRSNEINGGWRHRMNDKDCEKRHSTSRLFMRGMFEQDMKLRNESKKWRKEICDQMWKLNANYCETWNCCNKVGYRRKMKVVKRPWKRSKEKGYQVGYEPGKVKSWIEENDRVDM